MADRTLHMYLEAHKDREKYASPANISTSTIYETETLSEEPRKKLLKMAEEKDIGSRNIREITRKVKEFPEPEQQIAILDEME